MSSATSSETRAHAAKVELNRMVKVPGLSTLRGLHRTLLPKNLRKA